MQVIPAIDIIGGKCVRLTRGDYNRKKEYSDNPKAIAQAFADAGIRRLHVVDLDGAKAKHVVNLDTLRAITSVESLKVDFGGGVKTQEDLDKVLAAGAAQVTAGSIAANDREKVKEWIREYGADKIILGADVLNEQVMVSGWQQSSDLDLMEFLDFYVALGIKYVICTDISKDGVLEGPSFDLYQKILHKFPSLKLIASGGVSNLNDLIRLREMGLYGTIVGKAYYEGRITLEELSTI